MGIDDRLEDPGKGFVAIDLTEIELRELRATMPLQSWLLARHAAVHYALTIPGVRLGVRRSRDSRAGATIWARAAGEDGGRRRLREAQGLRNGDAGGPDRGRAGRRAWKPPAKQR